MKIAVTVSDLIGDGRGQIAVVDIEKKFIQIALEWIPPAHLRTEGKGFTGIARASDGVMLVCYHSAVCKVDPVTWEVVEVLSQPSMNDLHHLAISDEKMFLANTGLDRVDIFSLSGEFVAGYDMVPAWIVAERIAGRSPSREWWLKYRNIGWVAEGRGSAAVEYEHFPETVGPFPVRKTRSFVHPNHIAIVGGRPLVNRFYDRSIQDITSGRMVIRETPGHPHDGEVVDEQFWITCTNGVIVAYAIEGGNVTERETVRIDIYRKTGKIGWCRGLYVNEDIIIVGLTALTKIPRIGWSGYDIKASETALLVFDRRSHDLIATFDLQFIGDQAKIFGITMI